jgi:hypothetical protein
MFGRLKMVTRSTLTFWYGVIALSSASVLVTLYFFLPAPAQIAAKSTLHYSPNGNFDTRGNYLPGKIGFNLADVNSVKQLNSLPAGVKGLVWLGLCNGADTTFLDAVRPYIGNAKLFGFYLMDEPDVTGKYRPRCPADNLREEADWIHRNVLEVETFILIMNMSSSKAPSFIDTYNPSNSHVDLFGLAPYPCRTELDGCDYDMINRYIAAAESTGVPRSKIVPVYQTFGAGNWSDGEGGHYALPSVEQEQQLLKRWGTLIEMPVFDFAYSWGSQNADISLQSSAALQQVFALRQKPVPKGGSGP